MPSVGPLGGVGIIPWLGPITLLGKMSVPMGLIIWVAGREGVGSDESGAAGRCDEDHGPTGLMLYTSGVGGVAGRVVPARDCGSEAAA